MKWSSGPQRRSVTQTAGTSFPTNLNAIEGSPAQPSPQWPRHPHPSPILELIVANSAQLDPCPFCGAVPEMTFSHEAGRWDVYEVECDCGVSVYGPVGHAGDAAKAAMARKWNTRSPAPPRKDIARD